jgi:formylglycine-generating enzyme required for sulfatase activity
MKKLYMFLLVVLLVVITGCSSSSSGSGSSSGGSGSDPIAPAAASVKEITAFSLNGVAGTINETGKTIAIDMPFGTDVTALVATFTTTGASVKESSTVQISGTTANDFATPVVYTVTASDGTSVTYTAVVTVATASAKAITVFFLNNVAGNINETEKTIEVPANYGTDVTALMATFTTTGASVKVGSNLQVSGTMANDFTNPVVYTVTAADATTQDYTVTVKVAPSYAKSITAFSLNGVVGTINETEKTIGVDTYGTDVSAMVATFTTTGTSVKVGSTLQISGTTANDFTNPVIYTVRAADGTTQAYTVTVTTATISTGDYISANIGTLKYVPAGSFQRNATATNISTISTAFHMSQYEITRAQFLAIMGTDPSDIPNSSGTSDPVQMVNWYHAIAFCNKLSIAEGLTPVYSVSGINFTILTYPDIPTTSDTTWNAATADWSANGYRLPTEMEWEWAAMGATSGFGYTSPTYLTGYEKLFAGSNGTNLVGDYAWTVENSTVTTHPVGTKLPNELGLYDMSGNVAEWCWDWYAPYPSGSLTSDSDAGRGAASGTTRILRGGTWVFHADNVWVATRGVSLPDYETVDNGFRVVRQ